MKNLIITIGIICLMSLFLAYESDMNLYSRNCKMLDSITKDAAVSISTEYNEDSYGEGYIVYKDNIDKKASEHIYRNINRDYWKGGYRLEVEWISENTPNLLTKAIYKNNNLINKYNKFPDDFPSEQSKYTPRVRVTVTAYNPDFKLGFLKNVDANVKKIGISEYQGHEM